MKTTIEVEIITTAVELIAVPGDRLMVLNGTVIGIAPPEARIAIPHVPKPASRPPPTMAEIEELLKTKGPMTTWEAGKQLGLAPNDAANRHHVSKTLRNMLRFGRVEPADQRSRPAYRLVVS